MRGRGEENLANKNKKGERKENGDGGSFPPSSPFFFLPIEIENGKENGKLYNHPPLFYYTFI